MSLIEVFRVQRTEERPSRDAHTDGRVFQLRRFLQFCVTRPTERGPDGIFKRPCTQAPTPLDARLHDRHLVHFAISAVSIIGSQV